MEIKMNIECKGILKGSCGWVAEKLKDAKLVIEQNYIFVQFADGKYKVIAGVNDDEHYYIEHARLTEDERFWYAHPCQPKDLYYVEGENLFNVPLTDAAWYKVNRFIRDALGKFIDAWEGDTDEYDEEVNC